MNSSCGLAGALLWLSLATAAAGQTANALSLSQAVDKAIGRHPQLRSAQLGIDLAANRVSEAKSARLPALRISETVTRGNNPVFVFGSLLEQSRFGPQNFSLQSLNSPQSITNLRTSLSATLPAFDGFKTSANIAQADLSRDQAVLQKTLAEQRVRFEVVRNYFGVLAAEAGLRVAEEAVRLGEADEKRAKDRVDAGLGVASDLLSAQVQLAGFRQQRIHAEGELAAALAALNISIGDPAGTPRTLTTELLARTFDMVALDEFANRALANRPEYRMAGLSVEVADRRISQRRGEYMPEVNVFASVGTSGQTITTGNTDYSFGAGVTFNIFDGGRGARLNQAGLEKAVAQSERDRVADQLRIEVVRAYHAYRSAEAQLAVAESTLSQAAEALRVVQDRYEAGLTTIVDLLQAETAVVRARMNVADSRHGQYAGYANLLLAAGELDDVRAFGR